MIIIITPEEPVKNETEIINALFWEGLDLLHLRKPFFNSEEMMGFIQGIDPGFHQQLVVHNHYEAAEKFDISRFHFRETDRQNYLYASFTAQTISTSVHDMETYNSLNKIWEYAFISPVFPSISKKGYGANTKMLDEIKNRRNAEVKLIALGGIDENNIRNAFDSGANGAALLGAVWKSDEPVEIFKKCRLNVLL